MYMVLCVVDQPERLTPLLTAWRKNGINGVTILESTGLHRLIQQPLIPMRYALGKASAERGNVTVFTVVDQEETVQRCLEIAESVIGDFNAPNTGIFVAWPLDFAKGVTGKQPHTSG